MAAAGHHCPWHPGLQVGRKSIAHFGVLSCTSGGTRYGNKDKYIEIDRSRETEMGMEAGR